MKTALGLRLIKLARSEAVLQLDSS